LPELNILIVEDFERFRRSVSLHLRRSAKFQAIHEASDGLEAVQRAEELQPDLILLDIGLPSLNGIEAARRIRRASPNSKILFVSQESSAEVVQEALHLGAHGYLLKVDAAGELLPAVDAVLEGRQYLSRRLRPTVIPETHEEGSRDPLGSLEPPSLLAQKAKSGRTHEVVYFRDDASLVAHFSRFAESALKLGNPIIVVATASHRSRIQDRLEELGWKISTAIKEGSYIPLDNRDALSQFMVDEWPDTARFLNVTTALITEAAKAAKGKHARVAACGECAPVLIAQGQVEAAIQLERLWDQIARKYDIDVLCGYLLSEFPHQESGHILERVLREHSAAYSV
jgi:DNA-binding NarL/FixJ family response regulator